MAVLVPHPHFHEEVLIKVRWRLRGFDADFTVRLVLAVVSSLLRLLVWYVPFFGFVKGGVVECPKCSAKLEVLTCN